MLFRSSCPSPNPSYRFWLLALTFRSSRPAYGGRLTSPVSKGGKVSRVEVVDITDTLIEYGPSTIDFDSQTVVYTFVKFKSKGRVLEFGVLRSGQGDFESMLGSENIRFVWIDGKNISTKKKERLLTAFGSKEKSYKVDILDEETHGDKAHAIKFARRFLLAVRAIAAIALLPSIFFIPMIIPEIIIIWFSHRALKQLNSFIEKHKSIMNEFSDAENL